MISISLEKSVKAKYCGHKTKLVDTISAFGESRMYELPIVQNVPGFCHECYEKMATQCSWCGRPIFVGDAITIEKFEDKPVEYVDFDIITVFSLNPLRLIGCARKECCPDELQVSGIWVPRGRPHIYPLIYDLLKEELKTSSHMRIAR